MPNTDSTTGDKSHHVIVDKVRIMKEILKDSRLKGKFTRIIGALLVDEWTHQGGTSCYPGFRDIGKKVGCKRDAIIAAVEELEKYGWYEVTRTRKDSGENAANYYELVVDPDRRDEVARSNRVAKEKRDEFNRLEGQRRKTRKAEQESIPGNDNDEPWMQRTGTDAWDEVPF